MMVPIRNLAGKKLTFTPFHLQSRILRHDAPQSLACTFVVTHVFATPENEVIRYALDIDTAHLSIDGARFRIRGNRAWLYLSAKGKRPIVSIILETKNLHTEIARLDGHIALAD